MGISEDNQKNLFKLFGKVKDTEEMNTKGVGLGLAISLKIIEEFGGTISLKSKPNIGSNFTFKIALEESFRRTDSFNGSEFTSRFQANSSLLYFEWRAQETEYQFRFTEPGVYIDDPGNQGQLATVEQKVLIVDD